MRAVPVRWISGRTPNGMTAGPVGASSRTGVGCAWSHCACRSSYAGAGRRLLCRPGGFTDAWLVHNERRSIMGKYLLAWLLGVPGIVLLIVYLFFH
jgi:hypothetical protein